MQAVESVYFNGKILTDHVQGPEFDLGDGASVMPKSNCENHWFSYLCCCNSLLKWSSVGSCLSLGKPGMPIQSLRACVLHPGSSELFSNHFSQCTTFRALNSPSDVVLLQACKL